MSKEIKISLPTKFSNIRECVDLSEIYIEYEENKKVSLIDVLCFVLKQIEQAQKPTAHEERADHE